MTNILFSIILAMTLYGEAGVDSMAGKRHVAGVIYNRTEEYTRNGIPLWQATTAACLKKNAFSCWNEPFEIDYKSPQWFDCVRAAQEIEEAGYRSPTKSTHYHSGKMKRFPAWSRKMKYLGRVDSHLFYVER